MRSATDPHKRLRDDVRRLGDLLGDTLRTFEGSALLDRVEEVRALAKQAHSGDTTAFSQLSATLAAMPLEAAVPVARQRGNASAHDPGCGRRPRSRA